MDTSHFSGKSRLERRQLCLSIWFFDLKYFDFIFGNRHIALSCVCAGTMFRVTCVMKNRMSGPLYRTDVHVKLRSVEDCWCRSRKKSYQLTLNSWKIIFVILFLRSSGKTYTWWITYVVTWMTISQFIYKRSNTYWQCMCKSRTWLCRDTLHLRVDCVRKSFEMICSLFEWHGFLPIRRPGWKKSIQVDHRYKVGDRSMILLM